MLLQPVSFSDIVLKLHTVAKQGHSTWLNTIIIQIRHT